MSDADGPPTGDYDQYGNAILGTDPIADCNQACLVFDFIKVETEEDARALSDNMTNNTNIMDFGAYSATRTDTMTDVFGEMSGFFRERCEKNGF